MTKQKDPLPEWGKMYTVAKYKYWGMTWKEIAHYFFPDKHSLQRFRVRYDKLAYIMALNENQKKQCFNCNEPYATHTLAENRKKYENNWSNLKKFKQKLLISDKLADKGLWNPDLVSEITYITGGKLMSKQTLENEGFRHQLEWRNTSNKTELILEIADGIANLIINPDCFMSQRDELALLGIATKYNLKFKSEN